MPALRLALFALLSLLLTFSGVASASAGTCPAHHAHAAAPAAVSAHAHHHRAAAMAMPASVAAHVATAGHEHHAAAHAHGAPATHAHACAKTCVCAQACTGGAATVASAGFAGNLLPGHAERPRTHLAPAPRSAQPFAPLRPPRTA